MGLFGDVFGFVTGLNQNKQANAIHPDYHAYETSPYAKSQLGLAQQMFNGRMPGAAQEEQNIAASQANYGNQVNRNATDSSQALALQSLSQGQSNNQYSNLQQKEGLYKSSMLGNLNAGYQALVGEGDKIYQSQLEKYYSDLQQKMYYKNASQQNIFGSLNDLGGSLFTAGAGMGSDKSGGNDQLGSLLSMASLFL